MPLSSAPLKDGLAKLLGPEPPGSAEDAGMAWAGAYRGYAAKATAAPTVPLAPALLAAETTLAGALKDAFEAGQAAGPGGAAAVVPLLDQAFVAFWLTPPLAFAAPPVAGLVSAAPPGVLAGALAGALAAGLAGAGADAQAATLAAALDAWTRTVMVVNTTPAGPQPPVPLT